jgi:hypothetical protein
MFPSPTTINMYVFTHTDNNFIADGGLSWLARKLSELETLITMNAVTGRICEL